MKLRRIISIILIVCMVLTMVFTLCAWSKTGKCDNCEQKEKLKKYVGSDGETYWLCEDCLRWAKLWGL